MAMADPVADECEWCGEAPWEFSCAKCDPRKEKRVCLDCAKRWHSRGVSREHPLVDRVGTTRRYLEWLVQILNDPETTKANLTTAIDATDRPSESTPEGTSIAANANQDSVVEETQPSVHESEEPTIEYDGGGDDAQEPEVPQEIPAQLSEETQLDLEDVLSRLPTDDRAILDALADHIHDMIRLEDAILCQRHTKCQAPACQSILSHQYHVLERKVCAIPTCQAIASYMAHMEFCTKSNCPFCVRIQQRRLFGKKQALDHAIQIQRRELQTLRRNGGDQAQENFLEDQIRALERKKRRPTDEVENLNSIVVNDHLPIFNFPRFSWHITNEPIIKEEPIEHIDTTQHADDESSQIGAAESMVAKLAPTNSSLAEEMKADKEIIHSSTLTEEKQGEQGEEISTGELAETTIDQDETHDQDVLQTEAFADDDYVTNLLTKKESGQEGAREAFEESVQLALRIVDASFCSPLKATRCLLGCQQVLLHLQHHVDLQVCTDKMCETVEQHFSHLSKCQNEGTEGKCEYCLRVTERESARAVEFMEADQVETDLKIQRLITAMTESLANDPRDEREQNVMQLEDELQQAEAHKKELLTKIEAARMNLMKSRRRMKRHAANPPPSHVTGLPIHWVKSASPSSRRRRH